MEINRKIEDIDVIVEFISKHIALLNMYEDNMNNDVYNYERDKSNDEVYIFWKSFYMMINNIYESINSYMTKTNNTSRDKWKTIMIFFKVSSECNNMIEMKKITNAHEYVMTYMTKYTELLIYIVISLFLSNVTDILIANIKRWGRLNKKYNDVMATNDKFIFLKSLHNMMEKNKDVNDISLIYIKNMLHNDGNEKLFNYAVMNRSSSMIDIFKNNVEIKSYIDEKYSHIDVNAIKKMSGSKIMKYLRS